ncbi:acyltransferase [Alkalicoccus luteus]
MSIIASSNHIFKDGQVTNKGESHPIIIEKGSWAGAHVVITSGVKVGESALIAAGAIVTKNVEKHSRVAGVPAKQQCRHLN